MRTKTVYPTGEIAHLWAHGTIDHARNTGNGNFSFEGSKLYSYSTVIAVIYRKAGFAPLALLSQRRYSNTTAGHLAAARGAVSHWRSMEVINVNVIGDYHTLDHEENIKSFIQDYKNARTDANNTRRKAQNRHLSLGLMGAIQDNITFYIEYFEPALSATIQAEIEALKSETTLNEAEMLELVKQAEAKEAVKNAAKLDEWKHFERQELSSVFQTYLRTDGRVIETSKGYNINDKEEIRGIHALYLAWVKNPARLVDQEIKGFKVQRSTEAGIVVGCHNIPASEIEYLADQMGWNIKPRSNKVN